MPKLPALKPRQVTRILEKAGFSFERQKGSHKIYIKREIGITVPIHNKDLRKGTLRNIIRQSGLTLEEFLDLI